MFPIERRILPNHNGRGTHRPIIIVNHITAGSKGSVINTFSNTANEVSSTFLNCRDGSIVQFCEITTKPKTNGFIKSPKSPVVIQMGSVNPNLYSVTIENEGYSDHEHGLDGNITEEQFRSLCWLHKYIQTEVQRIYGNKIPLNSHQVIGHRDIDSLGKALCPGNNFPFDRLYKELAVADSMSLEAYEEHLDYKSKPAYDRATAYAFAERIADLGSKLKDPKWGTEARNKLIRLTPILEEMNYSAYEGADIAAEKIVKRITEVSKNSSIAKWEGEAFRKLLIGAAYAKQVGVM